MIIGGSVKVGEAGLEEPSGTGGGGSFFVGVVGVGLGSAILEVGFLGNSDGSFFGVLEGASSGLGGKGGNGAFCLLKFFSEKLSDLTGTDGGSGDVV